MAVIKIKDLVGGITTAAVMAYIPVGQQIPDHKYTAEIAAVSIDSCLPAEYNNNQYYRIIQKEELSLTHRNPEKVEKFLQSHNNFELHINNSLSKVMDYFGNDSKVVLEVLEYTSEKPYSELVAWIQFNGDLDDGLDRFDSFENEYLLSLMGEFNGFFNFNIEFI